jgi:outer membrane protein assembly factor BamD
MNKLALLLLIPLLVLSGCHSTSKDERYNNMSPREIYDQGTKHVQKKRYTEAAEDFEALESRYPFGDYADKAQLGALYAYYLNEDYPAALPAVERFIRMYPRHPNVDYAYYMKGLIHYSESLGFFTKYLPMERVDRDATSAKKAVQAFQVLTTTFPNSIYTEDAKQRIVYLRNLLAETELVAARFYLRKGAYLAAANRASNVISQFDQSPYMAEALYIMVRAYRKLDLPQLANDSYRVLALNYPESRYLQDLG